jgi:hypothetical protein
MILSHEEMMQRGANRREGAPTVERLDERLLSGKDTFLFNIYSTEHNVNLGTAGQYYIPPCPEGKEWVRSPTVVPGTVEDIYPHFTDKEEYRSRAIVGDDVVKSILGIGAGQRAEEDIRRFGIFASKNEVPSKQELATAKAVLVKELQAEIREADQLSASADAKMRESAQNEKFYRAARYLNIKKTWLSESAEMTLCPFCSVAVGPTASICHGCNQVINQAQFEATKKALAGAAA